MRISSIAVQCAPPSRHRSPAPLAFLEIIFDRCFAVHDCRIIASREDTFLSMPSRKMTEHCPDCNHRNHVQANFCNHCGGSLKRQPGNGEGNSRIFMDVAHPITPPCRHYCKQAALNAFDAINQEQLDKARVLLNDRGEVFDVIPAFEDNG